MRISDALIGIYDMLMEISHASKGITDVLLGILGTSLRILNNS